MAVIALSAGPHILTVPIAVLPAGQSWYAYAYLSGSAVGATADAVSTRVDATSTGSVQNISLSVTVPSSGSYYVWIVVFVAGYYYGTFSQLNTIIVSTALVFHLQNPAASGVLWNLSAFNISTKQGVGSLELNVAVDKPQTLPFMTDFLLSWVEMLTIGNTVTIGPFLVHMDTPGNFTIDGIKRTLNSVPMRPVNYGSCQFIGTVSNAQGVPGFTVDLTLSALVPDNIYNLYHYWIGTPFRIRTYGATFTGLPYGDSQILIWTVPNGTKIFGFIGPTEDYGLCIMAAMAANNYSYSLKAYIFGEGETRYYYALNDYQFSGSFTPFNYQYFRTSTNQLYLTLADIRYVVSEVNKKPFAWALVLRQIYGYGNTYPIASGIYSVASGVDFIEGVATSFQTYPKREELQLWVNPDPNAKWIDYGSQQNRQINEFYGWQAISYY